ncbi:MAG TPA: hypothetical protein DCE41_07265 [Cytophagales bacterium]|nr:hypothetical protein [Cytophagales bacterium]HAA19596.1 hypothetical protein [Cytophagales bacterium]HAP60264.1 hypothetical protein [Cytophagales bacterium]
MAEETQDSVTLPLALVVLLWIGVGFALFTLADVFLPQQKEATTVQKVRVVPGQRMGEDPEPFMEVTLASGHAFNMEYETIPTVKIGDPVSVLSSALVGKLVRFRVGEDRIVQRIWGLYSGLMWVPMILLVTALLTWRRKEDAATAIPYLIAFIFSLFGTVVLLAYPG